MSFLGNKNPINPNHAHLTARLHFKVLAYLLKMGFLPLATLAITTIEGILLRPVETI
jgi:hypothetical protein